MTTQAPRGNRFNETLEKQLLRELDARPDMVKLRLRLLELYFEGQRADDFLQHARRVASAVRDRESAPEWRNVVELGRRLLPEEPLFMQLRTDMIDFGVGLGPTLPVAAAGPRRLGDDPAHRPLFDAIAAQYEQLRSSVRLVAELDLELIRTAGRPSPLYFARNLSAQCGGAQIYLKREDLSPEATHLTIAITGQTLLARQLGRSTMVTSSINGARGVVTASVAARLGMKTVVFMDASQISRQSGQVFRMQSMGARVVPTEARKLRSGDLREAALAHWAERPNECFVAMGLDSAPAPYPQMARDFSAAIGRECLRQVTAMTRRPPDVIVARVGNNADALGLFTPFLERSTTRLVGIEVREELAPERAPTAAERQTRSDSIAADAQAALNEEQKRRAQVILEGLEYPSVAREQQWLRSTGRVQYASATDAAARDALKTLARTEGLVAAIETSQAIAWACQEAARLPKDQSVVLMYAENPNKNIWALSRQIGLHN